MIYYFSVSAANRLDLFAKYIINPKNDIKTAVRTSRSKKIAAFDAISS